MIPCALSARERAALRRWTQHKIVAEAGALLGGSTVELARAARHVISIDRHEGYTLPTYRQFRANLDRYGAYNVTPIQGDALSILPSVEAEVAFIDLTGSYNVTLAALQATTAPLALVHDLGRPRCGGVEQAIRDVGGHVLEHVDTLAVVALR